MSPAARYSPCKVQECSSLVGQKGARGFCTKHYQMWRMVGDPCGTTAQSEEDRFWKKVAKGPRCWTWTASKDEDGYGMFKAGRTLRAHRWAYEHAVGLIPNGMVLDHLCRNASCVNPSHLEPVTNEENLLRGWGRRIKNGMTDECINGHKFTPENTYATPKGALVCRACSATSRRKYEQKRMVA